MTGILYADNISKSYGSGEAIVRALKPCTLSFEKGELAAITGRSGSGKSTLLRILAALDVPDSGEIYLEGKKITGLKDEQISKLRRTRLGFIYQDYCLFPEYTGYENVILPIRLDKKKENMDEIGSLMEELGITHCREKFPAEMSGGEQQRIAIARALAIHPTVIFADEPTGNLDSQSSEEVVTLLRQASKRYQQTIVMVTHDQQIAAAADRVVRICDGRIES